MKTKLIIIAIIWIILPSIMLAQSWEGTWQKNKNYILKISKVTANSFYFAFDCYNGDHMGQLEGTAKINGDKATYKQGDNCPVYFTLKGNTVVVKVDDSTNPDCFYDAGRGVFYDGTFKKKESKPKKK